MKIVQSYWSLPSQSQSMIDGRDNGGWLHKRYHYLSMALSCLLLRRFYGEVELVTDTAGKQILIETLKLPYTSVSTDLDQFSNYPPILWALPKLYTYSIQKTPFIHVDGDVFIWKAFKPSITQSAVVAQSPELEHNDIYVQSLAHLSALLGYMPEPFGSCAAENIKGLNAGVLGGTDVTFLSTFGATALRLIQENLDVLRSKCELGTINIILEQLLLCKLCENANVEVAYVVPTLSNDFKEVLNFHAVPIFQSYIHLIGYAKKDPLACEQVEYRLKYEFPEHYEFITTVIDNLLPAAINERSWPDIGINNNNNFSRTICTLEKMGISLHNNKELAWVDFRNIIKKVNKAVPRSYLRDMYRLDRHAKNVTCLQNESVNWLRKQKVYELLDKRSQDHILNCRLTLVPSAQIVQTSWSLKQLNDADITQYGTTVDAADVHYILVQSVNRVIIEEELFGWDQLLVYFYNDTISGNQLIIELEVAGLSNQTDFIQSIINFILVETVYKGRLIIK